MIEISEVMGKSTAFFLFQVAVSDEEIEDGNVDVAQEDDSQEQLEVITSYICCDRN